MNEKSLYLGNFTTAYIRGDKERVSLMISEYMPLLNRTETITIARREDLIVLRDALIERFPIE